MKNFIRRLQNKPERARRRILLLSSSILTLIIAAFWLASFSRFSNTSGEQAVATGTGKSPITALKENLSNAYSGFSETTATNTATTEEPTVQISTSTSYESNY